MSLIDKIKGKKTTEATDTAKPVEEAKVDVKVAEIKKEETKKMVKPVAASAAKNRGVYGVLVAPLITEKSSREEQFNKYAFEVAVSATKSEISKAIETRYGVKPIKINVLNSLGKTKRFGRKFGKQKDSRKAVITLPKGKSINVYEAGK